MKFNKIILTSLVGITAVAGAFATDYETVTSKKYVDTNFQEKVTAYDDGETAQLLTDSGTKGQINKRPIFTGGEYDPATQSTYVPTVGAMMAAIGDPQATMTWQTTGNVGKPAGNNDVAATNAYNTNFSDLANEWPEAQEHQLVDGTVLANALALKQNKLEAGTAGNLAQYNASGVPVDGPAIYDDTSGTYTAATDAGKIATAGFVETKQDSIDATADTFKSTLHPTYASGSLVATTGTDGTVGERGIATARHNAADPATGQVSLQNGDWVPTVSMLINEVNAAAPSGTANTLANYDGTGALGTGVEIYDTSVAYVATDDENKIATAGFVETKQDKKQCVQWVILDSSTNTFTTSATEPQNLPNTQEAHCWLWDLPA